MTQIEVGFIDVYVVRFHAPGELDVLVLRRGPGGVRPGSWEVVHGHIDPDERPDRCARRELTEETGLVPEKFYNLSRVDSFYEQQSGKVILIPVFVAFVARDANVVLSDEHDRCEWLPAREAQQRLTWPRERAAIDDILILLGDGGAGAVEDVLRVKDGG
jgi:dihydroneopterin triphosphate diphosphatase